MEEGGWDSFFSLLCPQGEKERGALFAVKPHWHPVMGGWSFDDTVQNLTWGRVF